MKLLIISHTEHYLNSEGEVLGWGPTISEINHLLDLFDEIYHCAPLHRGVAPGSSLPYISNKIRFVPLKPSGGSRMVDKISILTTAPGNLKIIKNTLSKVDVFQFRAPTGIGVYVIPWLIFFSGKKGWFKYAGNWEQDKPPLGYRIQKQYLVKSKRYPVTINGKWNNQPEHCLTFENPCLTDNEILEGEEILGSKDYSEKLNFIFVGRLDRAKGVHRILNAFSVINSERVGTIHLIGDGPERNHFEELAKRIKYDIRFHGFLPRKEVFNLYKQSHIFMLPSESEGFPKVLAEAANFGCIPVVSDISCLSDYVKNDIEGWLFDLKEQEALYKRIDIILRKSRGQLKQMAENIQKHSSLFTFEYYNRRIRSELLN